MTGALNYKEISRHNSSSIEKEKMVLNEIERDLLRQTAAALAGKSEEGRQALLRMSFPWQNNMTQSQAMITQGVELYNQLIGNKNVAQPTSE